MDKKLPLFIPALAAAILFLSLALLLPGASRFFLYLLPPLALALLAADRARGQERRAEEGGLQALDREQALFRGFRHDLSNQLQVITCLAQLGRGEQAQKALFSLNEKIKVFGECKRVAAPDLALDLGTFLFSLPAEASLAWAHDDFPAGEPLLAAAVPGLLPALTEAIKPCRVARVSLSLSGRGDDRLLAVAIDLAAAGEVDELLEKAGKPPLRRYLERVQADPDPLSFLCRIPLRPASAHEGKAQGTY